MQFIRQNRARKGFTLFELLVVLAVMSIMATMVAPNLLRLIQRSKLTGIVQESSILMRMARDYSIRYNTQTVVRADLITNEVIAFVDMDGVLPGDISDGIFNPIAGLPHRTTDWELARYQLPTRVTFGGPASDPAPVEDFSPVAGENVALFASNGSARDEGAIRFADAFGNFLQVRVSPRLTGRVRIEKYNDDDDEWYFRNETGKPWEWK